MIKITSQIRVFCLAVTSLALQPIAQFVEAAELTLTATEVGATVYEIIGEGSGRKETVLGQTPWAIKDVDDSEPRVYRIEKSGFAPVYVPISQSMKSKSTFLVTLHKSQEWAPSDIESKSQATAERIVDQIYSIQSLLDARKTAEAMGMAETLRATHPTSFSVRLVYANALLVSGEVGKAKALYTVLLSEVPVGRASIRNSIQKIVSRLSGSRVPASSSESKGNL